MAVTVDKPAPYATPSSILDLIGRYRSRGLPSPINADVLERAGIAGSLVPRTIQSLQTLDLINESGAPTPTFEAIRLAPEAEYPKRLEDWLKGAYADVFAFVDPTEDDETSVRDAFRSYQPVGQQGRMVVLFQGLCTAAGLMPDKATPPRARSSAPRNNPAPSIKRSGSPKSAQNPPPGNTPSSLPPPLAGLLASLPSQGEGWTKESREKFLTTFGAVLDFCFPIVKNAPATKENGGQT
jgi:hypothetical protein